jgi:aminoglycoside 3-N-acetyltransferase
MNETSIITKRQLIHDLRKLELLPGDTVMLHASVKSIGWIVGGPDMVLQALFEILGDEGTLMMFVSWEDHPYHLPEWSEACQRAYLEECPPFDVRTSRADHRAMSILAEYLRTWPGAVRSRHPFSYAAVGKHAEWIVHDHPWNYRDGTGSPLEKLCQLKGKVCLLGSPLSDITLLHYAEYCANVPHKRIARYRLPILQHGTRVWMDFEEYDTSIGIVDWPEDYFAAIADAYLAAGHGMRGRVGAASSYVFDAESFTQFGIAWMEEHFVFTRDTSTVQGV